MKLPSDEYLKVPVTEMMDKSILLLDRSTSINEAAKVMESKGTSSVLVKDSKSDSVIGIVTERDILYRAVAKNLGTFKVNIDRIMSSPVITATKEMTAVEAIGLMRTKKIRRLPVMDGDNIVGIVTLMSLVGNTQISSVELVELELPKHTPMSFFICPYCGSKFKDKLELSTHIDRIHLGSGLLEGDLRKWE